MTNSWATLGVDLLLDFDPAGGRRAGLEQALRGVVRSGRLAPGTRLPSSRALAAELRLSRGTVAAAFDQLVAEGHLVARQGSGTQVAGSVQKRGGGAAPGELVGGLPLDLRPGRPDVTTFPTAAWLRASRRALSTAPFAVYGYGDPRGRVELRTALSAYLARTRGVIAQPEQIVITTGYQQALSLTATVLWEQGARAFAMEDPGLALHRELVARSGHHVLALPVDERGARTDLLATGTYSTARGVVVTPAHQYPTGVTMHPDRRHALAVWARSCEGLVVEDDYDGEFRYDRQPVGAMQALAPRSCRLCRDCQQEPRARHAAGVARPAREHHRRSRRRQSPRGPAHQQLRAAHPRRVHNLGALRPPRPALAPGLSGPAGPTRRHDSPPRPGDAVTGIAGGLHALLELPGDQDEDEIVARAARHDLALQGLRSYSVTPGRHPPALVGGYGTPPEHAYTAALARLVTALAGL